MKRGLFIFILGVCAGIGYTQNDAFKKWADEGIDMGKNAVSGLFEDAKEATMGKDQSDILNGILGSAENIGEETKQKLAEKYKEEQLALLAESEK